jgi:hypothetical protein
MPLRVSENRTLSGIFGPERDKVTRECSKLHSVELYNLCSSLNIVRVIKSRWMRQDVAKRTTVQIFIGPIMMEMKVMIIKLLLIPLIIISSQ